MTQRTRKRTERQRYEKFVAQFSGYSVAFVLGQFNETENSYGMDVMDWAWAAWQARAKVKLNARKERR